MALAVVVALLQVAARSIRVRKKLMILLKKWKNLPQNQIFRRLLSLSLVCLSVFNYFNSRSNWCQFFTL
jgi:hypothetical protein